MILTPLQKITKNVGDLGKIIVAKCFEWLPKVQKIVQSGHTGCFALGVNISQSFSEKGGGPTVKIIVSCFTFEKLLFRNNKWAGALV